MPRRPRRPDLVNFLDIGFGKAERLEALHRSFPVAGAVDNRLPKRMNAGIDDAREGALSVTMRSGHSMVFGEASRVLAGAPENALKVVNADFSLYLGRAQSAERQAEVRRCFAHAFRALVPGGRFYLSLSRVYLDLTVEELKRVGFQVDRTQSLVGRPPKTEFQTVHQKKFDDSKDPRVEPLRLVAVKPVPGRKNPDFKSDPDFRPGKPRG